jgi:hypothetical protein
MPVHIFTGGEIGAACHGVKVPEQDGLVRMSHAYFFGP